METAALPQSYRANLGLCGEPNMNWLDRLICGYVPTMFAESKQSHEVVDVAIAIGPDPATYRAPSYMIRAGIVVDSHANRQIISVIPDKFAVCACCLAGEA